MKTYPRVIFAVIIIVLFSIIIFSKNQFYSKYPDFFLQSSNKYFSSALGQVDIDEINKNVFEKNGFTLIKNDLIPVLKRKIPTTCENVFLEWQEAAKNGLSKTPPKVLPNPEAFTLNNYSRSWYWYFDDTIQSGQGSERTWSKLYIEALIIIVKFNPKHLKRPYENESLAIYEATKLFNISGQEGAVIGSQAPWAEVFCLANGAKKVTTVEYQKYIITHPQMDFLYARDLPLISKNYYNKFDFVISFSSIEHSGLGRYGDPIDPIGDLREMNKIHCLLKPKGLLFLGFPIGVDTIVYNAHRIYGRIRLAMMFEGFQLLKIFHGENIMSEETMQQVFNNASIADHYLFVLQKIE